MIKDTRPRLPREDGHGQASLRTRVSFPGFLLEFQDGAAGDNPILPISYQPLFRSARSAEGPVAHQSIWYPQYGSPRSMQPTFVTVPFLLRARSRPS